MPSESESEVQVVEETIVVVCEGCDDILGDWETPTTVRVGRHDTEEWCTSCVDDTSFGCERCMIQYSTNSRDCVEVDDNYWCNTCAENNAYWCDPCGTWEAQGPCEGEEDTQDQVLMSYSYKPRPQFQFAPTELAAPTSSIPCYGIELETESVTDWAAIVGSVYAIQNEWADQFYMKQDGSLSMGMEIVSHPRSLESWREIAPQFGETLIHCSGKGIRAWERSRCGLHIHVGRDKFTTSHLARFALLFARNKYDWQRVANRTSHYASFDGIQGSAIAKVKRPDWSSHSDAVNFGANGATTVEVRIFRPSLAINRVIGSIELVDSAYWYTKNMTAHQAINGGLNFAAFIEYTNNNNYPLASRIIAGQRFTKEEGTNSCA